MSGKLQCPFFLAFTQNETLIKEIFDKYDENKDGVIDKAELKNIILDIAKKTGNAEETVKEYEKKFDEADVNKDQVLSYEEFKKIGPEIVEKMLLA